MARQRKVTQQTVADGSRLTGCVTRTHGRHHYVTTEDGNIYEAHRRGKKSVSYTHLTLPTILRV